jgi:hypothetical protein
MPLQDNDVLAGLQMFQQSVQSLAQTRAISQARETVDQIHASDLDEEQKLSAFKQLGRQFAFQAASMGMPLEQAKGLAEMIAPKPQFYQTADQAVLNAPEGSVRERAVALIDAKEQADYRKSAMEQGHADARTRMTVEGRSEEAERKRRENQRKVLDNQLESFTRQPDVKPLFEAKEQLGRIKTMDDAQLLKTTVGFNLGKKALARMAEPGKITDKDYEIVQGDPDLYTSTKRYISAMLAGKPIEADIKTVRAAAKVLGSAVERDMYDAAENYAASKQGIFDTIPADELRQRLHRRLGFGVTSASPGPGAYQQQGGAPANAPMPAGQSGGLRRYLVR